MRVVGKSSFDHRQPKRKMRGNNLCKHEKYRTWLLPSSGVLMRFTKLPQIQIIFGTIFLRGSLRSFAPLCFTISFCIISWERAPCETFLFQQKKKDKYFCSGKIITLIAEMARKRKVEHANFVCKYHWDILRSKNNICSYPLHMHP